MNDRWPTACSMMMPTWWWWCLQHDEWANISKLWNYENWIATTFTFCVFKLFSVSMCPLGSGSRCPWGPSYGFLPASQSHSQRLLRFNWGNSGWWRYCWLNSQYQLMLPMRQFQTIWQCNWCHLVTKYESNMTGREVVFILAAEIIQVSDSIYWLY